MHPVHGCFSHPEKGYVGEKNIWSKSVTNPLKSRVYTDFCVEKAVENVKTLLPFSPGFGGLEVSFPHKFTPDVENYGGNVVILVENP